MHLVHPGIKIIKRNSMPTRIVSLWFALICASTNAIPLWEVDSASGRGSTERALIASGASRSRVGWTIGTEQESSDLRVKFKVCLVCPRNRSIHNVVEVVLSGDTSLFFKMYYIAFPTIVLLARLRTTTEVWGYSIPVPTSGTPMVPNPDHFK